MEQNLSDIFDLIEHAIDNAFEGQMNLRFYDYLKDSKVKKHEIDSFISSSTTNEIGGLILDLDEYLKGVLMTSTNNCVKVMVIFLNLKHEKLETT